MKTLTESIMNESSNSQFNLDEDSVMVIGSLLLALDRGIINEDVIISKLGTNANKEVITKLKQAYKDCDIEDLEMEFIQECDLHKIND